MNALGVNIFKFNPIFNTNQELYENSNIYITSDEFAQMVIELFDVWYFHPDARVKESDLIEMCSNIVTQKPSACQFKANCQEIIYAINPTGEVCPCGRFCDDADQYSIGNIKNTHLSEILSKRKLNDLFRRSELLANGECKGCVFFNICHGGCPHDALSFSNNYMNKSFLCDAYKMIYTHIKDTIEREITMK